MFSIPPMNEELMLLCVPEIVVNTVSEFKRTVFNSLDNDLLAEKHVLEQVEESSAAFPTALLLACDTSCVPKEVTQQKQLFMKEGVAQEVQQKLQACEAKVNAFTGRVAKLQSAVQDEKARQKDDEMM